MECGLVSTHTLFHHYIRELKTAKETLVQTDKYLNPKSPNYLVSYIEKLEALQLSGQNQLEKIVNAKKNLTSYRKRANHAQDILNNHPKKLAELTGSNDVFLAPPEKQNECLYILDHDTCKVSCGDWNDEEESIQATVLFSGKENIVLDKKEQTDAVRIWQHNVNVSNLRITDTRHYNEAHRDAIQLIPPALHKNVDGVSRRIGDQLAGTILDDVCIRNCKIEAPKGPLQGIFASDGMHRNLRIVGNDIKTLGSHTISIAGLLTGGVISGNTLRKVQGGQEPKIRLYPARIGGNIAEDGVVTILSFAKEKGCDAIGYDSVDTGEKPNEVISEDGCSHALEITDLRGEVPSDIAHMSLGLTNFHYHAYLEEFSTAKYADFAKNDPVGAIQLQAWLRMRCHEYTNGRPKGHKLGPTSKEQQHIAEHELKPALDALRTGELNGVYISEIPQTAIRSFIMKRIAIKHGVVAPLKDIGKNNDLRQLTLRYLLAK